MGGVGLLIGTRALTEFVTPAVFGSASLLLGIATLFSSLFCHPLLQAVLRFYPEMRIQNCIPQFRLATTNSLLKAASILACVILATGILASAYFDGAFRLSLILAGLVLVDVAKAIESAWFNAARRQNVFVILSVLDAWVRPAVAVVLVLTVIDSVEMLLVGYLAASFIIVCLFWTLADREGVGWKREANVANSSEGLLREVRRYARPLTPLSLMAWISSQSDRYFIAALAGIEEAGIYAATYGAISRPFLMAATGVEQTVRPIYYSSVSRGDGPNARVIFRWWFFISAAIAGVLFCVVAIFSKQIAFWLLGDNFRGGAALMPWIAAGYSLLVLSYVFEQQCYAAKDTKSILRIRAIGGLSALTLFPVMVYFFGLLGAGISVLSYCGAQFVASSLAAMTAERNAELGHLGHP